MAILGPTRADLRTAAVGALQGATLAGAKVFDQRFWTLPTSAYPAILVGTPLETKQPDSATFMGVPKFDTDISLAISIRTASPANFTGSKAQAEIDLETMIDQVETILLSGQALFPLIQGITSVTTQLAITADGGPVVGEAAFILVANVRQEYWPDESAPLLTIEVNPPGSPTAEPTLIVALPQS